jgi:hypothetical protein
VIGYLLVLAMGTVAWYAWPAAPTFATRVWTVVFAVFLAPFSWPWLIARGYRHRRWRQVADTAWHVGRRGVHRRRREAEQLRQENITWWKNERSQAVRAGDRERAWLANETLKAMGYFDGFTVTRPGNSATGQASLTHEPSTTERRVLHCPRSGRGHSRRPTDHSAPMNRSQPRQP